MCVYIYVYMYVPFQILFHYRLLQGVEYSSLLCLEIETGLQALGCRFCCCCLCWSGHWWPSRLMVIMKLLSLWSLFPHCLDLPNCWPSTLFPSDLDSFVSWKLFQLPLPFPQPCLHLWVVSFCVWFVATSKIIPSPCCHVIGHSHPPTFISLG